VGEEKVAPNFRNAGMSTGPKTPEGKKKAYDRVAPQPTLRGIRVC